MKDDETFTRAELRDALARLACSFAPTQKILDDIVAHREPEYEVGEIYQDDKGRRFVRRDSDIWPWACITWINGDQISVTSNGHVCGVYLEEFPERPLRKLVPEDSTGSYAEGFAAGQEASDA